MRTILELVPAMWAASMCPRPVATTVVVTLEKWASVNQAVALWQRGAVKGWIVLVIVVA